MNTQTAKVNTDVANIMKPMMAAKKKSSVMRAEYDGQQLQFNGEGWFNATEAAKKFGKRPNDWLCQEATQEYIAALDADSITGAAGNWTDTKRGQYGGTWMHPDLAVAFARWLDVRFGIWCDRQIKAILAGSHPHFEQRRMRHAAAASNKFMRQMVERAREADGKETKAHHYINENLLVNKIVAGEFVGLDRDTMPAKLLDFLAATEGYNTLLYARGKSREDRIAMLMTFRRKWVEKHGGLPALNLADQPKLEARMISKELIAAPKSSGAAKERKVAKALKACRDAAANAVRVLDIPQWTEHGHESHVQTDQDYGEGSEVVGG